MKIVVEKDGKSAGEAITNPCVLVEVLSDSTERDDRGWKFRDYRTISSFEEHVLVAQDVRRVEVFRRSTTWQVETYEAGATFVVHGASIAVDAIYNE